MKKIRKIEKKKTISNESEDMDMDDPFSKNGLGRPTIAGGAHSHFLFLGWVKS